MYFIGYIRNEIFFTIFLFFLREINNNNVLRVFSAENRENVNFKECHSLRKRACIGNTRTQRAITLKTFVGKYLKRKKLVRSYFWSSGVKNPIHLKGKKFDGRLRRDNVTFRYRCARISIQTDSPETCNF